jgi:hypothetical protein
MSVWSSHVVLSTLHVPSKTLCPQCHKDSCSPQHQQQTHHMPQNRKPKIQGMNMSKVVCIILKCKKQRNYTIEAYLNWSWLQLKDLHHLVYQTLVPNLRVENFRACPSFTCNRPWTKSGQINPWIETQYICHFRWVPPWDEYQFSAKTSSRYCLDWREHCLRMEYQHEIEILACPWSSPFSP